MNSPCKECKMRRVGCHNVDTCKPWGEYVERVRAANEKRLKERMDCEDFIQHVLRHGEKLRDR